MTAVAPAQVAPVAPVALVPVASPVTVPGTRLQRSCKRAVDVVGAALLLILIGPVLLLIGAAIRLTSRGAAVYRSTRVGLDGREFTVFKLRTMYLDADVRRAELESRNEVAGGVLFKMRRDPRVTPIGRVLRRLSLDEIPQLFNVLNGTMSLVGPRPPLASEVARYSDVERRRLAVTPGLTGLWQVSGRSDLGWEESVGLDLHYVDNWSLALDAVILLRTVWAVLGGRGAY